MDKTVRHTACTSDLQTTKQAYTHGGEPHGGGQIEPLGVVLDAWTICIALKLTKATGTIGNRRSEARGWTSEATTWG